MNIRTILEARTVTEELPALRPVLGRWQLLGLGIGTIIGSGVFLIPGPAAALFAGPAIILSSSSRRSAVRSPGVVWNR
jgi:hypothetical protein